jgi:hypothetical protein
VTRYLQRKVVINRQCYSGGMATEPENLTLKQLSLLRTEMQEGFTLINNKIGALAEGMITMRRRALS